MATVATKSAPKRGGSSRRSSARKRSRRGGFGRAVSQAFDGHGHDTAGLLVLVVGLVCALSIYLDLAGPLGDGVAAVAGGAIGLLDVLVPPLAVVIGVALIRGDGPRTHAQARALVGAALCFVALAGLLHLSRGRPAWNDPASELGAAGGLLGVGLGGGLRAIAGSWGAGVLLVALLVLGAVMITGTSLKVVVARCGRVLSAIGRAIRRSARTLFTLRDESDPGLDPDATIDLDAAGGPRVVVGGVDQTPFYDQESDADAVPDVEPEPPAEPVPPKLVLPEPDEPGEQLSIDLGPAAAPSSWKLPTSKVLKRSSAQDIDTAFVEARGRKLESALAEHGVETRLVGMVVGPTVTRYELELGAGVKVARVTSLNRDIAYAMASPDVRILAPIPGRQAIGVEVPNEQREVVALGDILSSSEAQRATHPLEAAIGRDINGRSVLLNLANAPHILIAGATGAGKSSCINSLITSILMRSTPDQVRLILVDPKRVEMGQYGRVPHLLTQPVTDPKKAANALAWAVREMERRYDLLSEVGFRDITGYNAAYDRGDLQPGLGQTGDDGEPRQFQRLPFILVVVDELADLMMVAARDVEESICRIAQMARAVGIHLVIATQRPSVNVITGVIKANIPARLAFAVSSLQDSRVILDQPGAERLVGKGDMLLLGPSSSVAQRIQGCWVDEDEVRKVVAHWRRQAREEPAEDESVTASTAGSTSITDDPPAGSGGGGGDDDDELLLQAMELVVHAQLGSTSMLQRKLRVGFARAGRLMDLLEQRGIVGPSEGSKARAVLMTPEELEERV